MWFFLIVTCWLSQHLFTLGLSDSILSFCLLRSDIICDWFALMVYEHYFTAFVRTYDFFQSLIIVQLLFVQDHINWQQGTFLLHDMWSFKLFEFHVFLHLFRTALTFYHRCPTFLLEKFAIIPLPWGISNKLIVSFFLPKTFHMFFIVVKYIIPSITSVKSLHVQIMMIMWLFFCVFESL